MPAINTTNASLEHTSMDSFHVYLDGLLKDNLKNYNETTLMRLMDYLTRFIKIHTISETDLNKLISIRAKFLGLFCAEAISNNQTYIDGFANFTQAIQEKEEFFHPSYTQYQTRLQSCETTPDNPTSSSSSLATQLGTAAAHGVFSGSMHAVTTIALDSAKNKAYTETQIKLFKAGAVVFNSLTIASYAALATYLEAMDESEEAASIIKMLQSFALSFASTTGLQALIHGINYFAKPKNKLIKGFLNALPLAGNLGLLASNENNLAATAARIGVNIGSASVVSTAIQTGWHFFSKRRNATPNTDVELNIRDANELRNSLSSINETAFSNGDISTLNSVAAPVYAEIEEGVVYASMERLDEECYLVPNNSSPATHSSPNPLLPDRNLRFLLTGGLDVSAMSKEDDNIITPSSSFSNITYSN